MTIPGKENLVDLYLNKIDNNDIVGILCHLAGFNELATRKMFEGIITSTILIIKITTYVESLEQLELLKNHHFKTACPLNKTLLLTEYFKAEEFIVAYNLQRNLW